MGVREGLKLFTNTKQSVDWTVDHNSRGHMHVACMSMSCNSRTRFSGWKGLKTKERMVSVKVNRLTFVPVLAFHMVMTPGLSMTAIKSLQES